MTARPATTRRASQPPTAAVLVAVVLAVLAIVVGAAGRVDTQASTTTGQVAGTRVRASTPLHQGAVEAAQAVVAGQGRETTVVAAGAAIGSRVAPRTVAAGGDDTVDLFRAVGVREFDSVTTSSKFLPGANSLEGRQFALTFDEALAYADTDLSKVAILKATVDRSALSAFDFSRSIDPFIFRSGV